nr:hypothetical protein [uncultured Mucilaginibacter sp.]
MQVPESWTRVDVRGIDSFVGRIDIDSNAFIGFDLGWYCDSLGEGRHTTYYSVESGSVYVPDSAAKQNLSNPTVWKYFGKADSITIAKLRRNVAVIENVDGYHAKIVTPKRSGLGITGIYIDSLWKSGGNVDGFVMTAHNLTFEQQKKFISAIKSLKFNRNGFKDK